MRRLFAFLSVTFALAVPQPAPSQTVRYNQGDPLRFGVGYNTLTGEYAGNCMLNPRPEDIQPAGAGDATSVGQLTKWELSIEQDLSSLTEKLDFSASASASFIGGSASASVSYMKSRSFNRFHEFVYVSAAIANTTQVWTQPALTREYLALRKDPLSFLAKCGDTFVRTITDGGELTAILDVFRSAEEDTSSQSAAVRGEYGSANGQAQFTQTLEQRIAKRSTNVKVIRNGSTGELPAYTADELIQATRNFPQRIAKKPIALEARLASYNTVAPPVELTEVQEVFIKPLFRAYKRAMEEQGNLRYIQTHSSEFRTVALISKDSVAPDASGTLIARVLNSRLVPPSEEVAFKALDKNAIDVAVQQFETYTDKLELMARRCVKDTKRGCADKMPAAPTSPAGVARIFSKEVSWNPKSGPVDIVLDSAFLCELEDLGGVWQIGSDPAVRECKDTFPKKVTNGHIVAGSFAAPNQYHTLFGSCTYRFMCTTR